MSDSGSTLNIPQLLVIVVVSFLIFRWYNSSPSGQSPQRPHGARNAAPRVNPAAVEQISQMFPQLNRRDIMWDLSRNGNNVAATTERILGGTGLESPPPSYQPPMPAQPAASQGPSNRNSAPAPSKPDLITRYKLASKIQDDTAATPAEETLKKSAWSQNKAERQQNLQRRREEMILAARRKMIEKDKAKTAQS
ncbi:Ubiquitin system component Cue [Botryosphaeria dothidea]|uniref:Coupling of ubiquitin conjugation to ER degradation protein 1 n=1 Tax=Botryosphaeria dothidea TaxID=55169 RepID=A0A8H4N136_9PEZI|nr:Ubiquitin system component Cue [Botryosphaeria dothidea]